MCQSYKLWDPPIIACSIQRKAHYMAKENFFITPLRYILTSLGAFPIRRKEADREL